ncbi:hypothetical protein AYI68_g5482 [Smittium mucronatum]|uniref:PWWP domain-containing protein n=1 Tax=Smittium mucronatum TaxID=133383 RepID=A0A1R0GU45_9FUNG|nr:hypothetical protein AYI68_g5482 [Smittium mucronatum]
MDESILSSEVMRSKPRYGVAYPVMFFGSVDFAWLTAENLDEYKENIERYSLKTKNRKEPKFGLALKQAEDPHEISRLIKLITLETEEEREYLKNGGNISGSSSDPQSDSDENSSDVPKTKKPSKGKSTPAKRRDSAPPNTSNKKSRSSATPTRSNRKSSPKNDQISNSEARKSVSSVSEDGDSSTIALERKSSSNEAENASNSNDTIHKNGKFFESLMVLRHRIQRSLLKTGQPPSDYSLLDEYFRKVEKAQMTLELLQTTKMGKLMRRVSILENIPEEIENKYRFKSRANEMTSEWRKLVPSNRAYSEKPKPAPKNSKPLSDQPNPEKPEGSTVSNDTTDAPNDSQSQNIVSSASSPMHNSASNSTSPDKDSRSTSQPNPTNSTAEQVNVEAAPEALDVSPNNDDTSKAEPNSNIPPSDEAPPSSLSTSVPDDQASPSVDSNQSMSKKEETSLDHTDPTAVHVPTLSSNPDSEKTDDRDNENTPEDDKTIVSSA